MLSSAYLSTEADHCYYFIKMHKPVYEWSGKCEGQVLGVDRIVEWSFKTGIQQKEIWFQSITLQYQWLTGQYCLCFNAENSDYFSHILRYRYHLICSCSIMSLLYM